MNQRGTSLPRERHPKWKGGVCDNKAVYLRNWRKENEAKVRDREYKKRFGISLADYEAMLMSQSGLCAICRRAPKRRRLNVDHCHSTGIVRGLLCDTCNLVIGQLEDSPDLLHRAAVYIADATAKVMEGVLDASQESGPEKIP